MTYQSVASSDEKMLKVKLVKTRFMQLNCLIYLYPKALKPILFPLLDDVSVSERMNQLQSFYPRKKLRPHVEVSRPYNQ